MSYREPKIYRAFGWLKSAIRPIATKFRSAASCREGPFSEVAQRPPSLRGQVVQQRLRLFQV